MDYRTTLNHIVSALLIGMGTSFYQPATAAPSDIKLAQLFYPPANSPRIIAVTGQGKASVPADTAHLEFIFTNRDPNAPPDYSPDSRSESPKKPEPEPITEASLAPIVTALKNAGIPTDKIQINVEPGNIRRSRYNQQVSSIAIDVVKPTRDQLKRLVSAVGDAVPLPAGRRMIFLDNVSVQYFVTSCEAVETAAYKAALDDAQLRATAIATAMNVPLPQNPSVAELPFLGRFYTPCSQTRDIIEELFRRTASSYSPEIPTDVEVFREIAVTYTLPQ